MSKATKLNEGIVTSLADTDLLVAADSAGTMCPISVTNLMQLIRDNIKVGGRNLIPDSAKFEGWTAKQSGYKPDGTDGILSVRKSTGAFFGAYRMMSFAAGATYTFSFYVDSPNEIQLFLKYLNDSLGSQTADFGATKKRCRQISQNWYQISVTATCTKSGTAILEIESANIQSTETVRYCAPKLEIGNIPTDWSPAPEDLSGGVMCRHSIIYDCAPSERQKGVPHEQSDKHQRRSYTILTQGNHIQRIAERDNDRCSRGERVGYEGRQRQRDNHPRGLHCCLQYPNTRSSLRDIHVWQSDGGKRWALYLPDIPHGRRQCLSAQKICGRALEYLVQTRLRHTGHLTSRGKEVVAI